MLALLLTLMLASSPSSPEPPAALVRAGEWMAAYAATDQPLNLDAVLVLAQIRSLVDTPGLALAFERANARLDRDRGHPLRRLVDPDFHLPPELSRGWPVPAGPAPPVNPDRVLAEALYCDQNGLRPEAVGYLCKRMGDGGGYYSTHALWAALLAQLRGCFGRGWPNPCLEALRREVLAAQPLFLTPWSTLDVDLFAERLAMLQISGGLPPEAVDGVSQLLQQQNPDGSWGLAGLSEPPYFRFHATLVAAWLLAAQAAVDSPASH